MDLYAPIFRRASTRKFDPTPLPGDVLSQLEDFISQIKPLLPDAALTCKIVSGSDVKGMALPKAPHFLLISGKAHPLRNPAAGFLGQHAELWLYAQGYATRWLAGVKPKQADPDFIIGMAFGKPAAPAERTLSEFKRKSLSEISKGADSRLEAARLAPSGMNGQPWYFIVDGDKIHTCCRPTLGGLTGRMYHFTDLDVGIALCHLAVASAHAGKPFRFAVSQGSVPTPPAGFVYVGTVC